MSAHADALAWCAAQRADIEDWGPGAPIYVYLEFDSSENDGVVYGQGVDVVEAVADAKLALAKSRWATVARPL